MKPYNKIYSTIITMISLVIILFVATGSAKADRRGILVLPVKFNSRVFSNALKHKGVHTYYKALIGDFITKNMIQRIKQTKSLYAIEPTKYTDKSIRKEFVISKKNDDLPKSTDFIKQNHLQYLIIPYISFLNANRNLQEISEDTYNYRDSGLIEVTFKVLDMSTYGNHNEYRVHKLTRSISKVRFRTPYQLLETNNMTVVNQAFLKSITKKVADNIIAKLFDITDGLYITSSTTNQITVSRGSLNSNIKLNQKYAIINPNKENIGIAQITKINDTTSIAKIIIKNNPIKDGYDIQLITK